MSTEAQILGSSINPLSVIAAIPALLAALPGILNLPGDAGGVGPNLIRGNKNGKFENGNKRGAGS